MDSQSNKKTLSHLEISAFCQQIAMVLDAGISTYEGITILAGESEGITSEILGIIAEQLESGSTFAEALKSTDVFPAYAVQMVHVGEMTGRLDAVLFALSEYYEREFSIRENIRHAITYPLIMTILMLVVLFVMIIKVLPVFNHIYSEFGSELTGFAHLLMLFSSSLQKYYLVFIIVVLVAAAAGFIYLRTSSGRRLLSSLSVNRDIAVSRLTNTLSLCLSSGLDTDQGLSLALSLMENPFIAEKIRSCQKTIESGKSFSESIQASGIFHGVEQSMVTIASRTGKMDEIMKRLSVTYEESADQKIQRFISWLEPALVVILSVLIGIIMLTFLVPLLGIISTLG